MPNPQMINGRPLNTCDSKHVSGSKRSAIELLLPQKYNLSNFKYSCPWPKRPSNTHYIYPWPCTFHVSQLLIREGASLHQSKSKLEPKPNWNLSESKTSPKTLQIQILITHVNCDPVPIQSKTKLTPK